MRMKSVKRKELMKVSSTTVNQIRKITSTVSKKKKDRKSRFISSLGNSNYSLVSCASFDTTLVPSTSLSQPSVLQLSDAVGSTYSLLLIISTLDTYVIDLTVSNTSVFLLIKAEKRMQKC